MTTEAEVDMLARRTQAAMRATSRLVDAAEDLLITIAETKQRVVRALEELRKP